MSAATLAGLASLRPRAGPDPARRPRSAAGTSASASRRRPRGGCRGLPVARGAEGGARRRDAGRDQRPEQPHVGDGREPRRRRVRGGLLRRQPRRAVAGQPRHLRAEGEHGQRLQPRRHVVEQRIGPGQGPRALDRQPLFRRAAGRQPLRAAAQQPGRHRRRLRGGLLRRLTARPAIRWSITPSAASTSSAAASASTPAARGWSAASASAATRRAPTTTSRGGCGMR